MTEDNLDELAGQRDAAGLAPVSRRCPECGKDVSSELYVDEVRRRLEDWTILLPRLRDL